MLRCFLLLIFSFAQNIFNSDILELVTLKKNQLRLSFVDARQQEISQKIAVLEKKIGVISKSQPRALVYFEKLSKLPTFFWQVLFLLSLLFALFFLRTKKYYAFFFFAIVCLAGIVLLRKLDLEHQLIVVSDKAEFFAGPGERYPRLNPAPFGRTFCYSKQQNGFFKVDGYGWLEPSVFMVLD